MENLNLDQNQSFGVAIEAIKAGKQVARKWWNGKGMFIYLNHGSFNGTDKEPEDGNYNKVGGVDISLFKKGDEGTVTRMPNINMKAADGSTVTGWLASQTDMLASGWNVIN